MNKTSYLLPHSFQHIGWGLLIACPVLLVLNLWIFNGLKLIPQSYSQFGTLVLYITAALSALFVGLSEEKQEDEFIQTLRLRSIANTAWICFILMIVSALAIDVCQAFKSRGTLLLLPFYKTFNSIIFAFFLYIALFRFRLFKYRKEACHEE
jgi:hypothetical protein